MKIRGQFLVALRKVKCAARLNDGINLLHGLRLLDDASRVACVREQEFKNAIGSLELGALLNADLLFATETCEFDVEQGTTGPEIIGNLLNVVRTYLFHLWMLRDNCAYFEQGFLFEPDKRITHSNLLVTTFSKADGSHAYAATFSRKELDQLRLLIRDAYERVSIEVAGVETTDYEKRALKLVAGKGVDSYSRFQRFIAFARETRDVGMKIALYCSALETLLSTSTTELTHRISERVALLIADTEQGRIATYEEMKKLYSIRSAVVHGSDIPRKHLANLAESSTRCDQIVRAVAFRLSVDAAFRTAIFEDEVDADTFFLRKMFGQ